MIEIICENCGTTKVEYNGIIFRSKFEARSAKWMDWARFTWQYEPEKFILNSGGYTPDFYLEELDLWVDTKGWLKKGVCEKYQEFALEHPFLMLFDKDVKLLEKEMKEW